MTREVIRRDGKIFALYFYRGGDFLRRDFFLLALAIFHADFFRVVFVRRAEKFCRRKVQAAHPQRRVTVIAN